MASPIELGDGNNRVAERRGARSPNGHKPHCWIPSQGQTDRWDHRASRADLRSWRFKGESVGQKPSSARPIRGGRMAMSINTKTIGSFRQPECGKKNPALGKKNSALGKKKTRRSCDQRVGVRRRGRWQTEEGGTRPGARGGGGECRSRSRARRVPRYASLEEALLDGESSWMMPP